MIELLLFRIEQELIARFVNTLTHTEYEREQTVKDPIVNRTFVSDVSDMDESESSMSLNENIICMFCNKKI